MDFIASEIYSWSKDFFNNLMEARIQIIIISLKKLGFTKKEAVEIVNTVTLEELEKYGSLNYNRFEEACFKYAFENIKEDTCEFESELVEYSDNKEYSLNEKEKYEELFLKAFDELDYESVGVIIEVVLNKEEENIDEDYVNAVNKLVNVISKSDEEVAQYVYNKLMKKKDKVKSRS